MVNSFVLKIVILHQPSKYRAYAIKIAPIESKIH